MRASRRPFWSGRWLCLLALLGPAAWPGTALAQGHTATTATTATTGTAASNSPSWADLSAEQRLLLAPLQSDWATLDAPRRQKWLEVAARFGSMSPDEQARVQARMSEWARMSPAQRARARVQFQEARQVPAEELQTLWRAYQSLPEEERRRLGLRSGPDARPPRGPADRTDSAAAPKSKANLVQSGTAPAMRSVSPAQLNAQPGATTTPIGSKAAPPHHQQAGLPKIAATPGFVDKSTLLPQRGPQGAAASPAASEPQTRRQR